MKKFFKKVISAVKQWWSDAFRNLPLRMTAGRFGIWLMSIGRFLQVRYANWNGEFRLKHEFCTNPDYCIIHVSDPVIKETIITFDSPNSQPDKSMPIVQDLFDINGVAKVTIQRYRVSIEKGHVYRWEELLPDIENILLKHLAA